MRGFLIYMGVVVLVAVSIVGTCAVFAPRAETSAVRDFRASQVLSTTIYTPFVRHISPDACRTMFPADEVGALCDYYEGINLPDLCAPGYHLETQTTPSVTGPASSSVPMKVCHLDSARGERGAGLDCQKGAP